MTEFADGGMLPDRPDRFAGRLDLLVDAGRCLGGGLLPKPDLDRLRRTLDRLNAPLLWQGDQA